MPAILSAAWMHVFVAMPYGTHDSKFWSSIRYHTRLQGNPPAPDNSQSGWMLPGFTSPCATWDTFTHGFHMRCNLSGWYANNPPPNPNLTVDPGPPQKPTLILAVLNP
jgi:hypothetical protein